VKGSIDLADLTLLRRDWSSKGDLLKPEGRHMADTGSGVFESVFGREWIVILVVAFLAVLRGNRSRSPAGWLVLAMIFLVLSLGPVPLWQGAVIPGLSLPYAWLYKWMPGFSRFVVPGRAFLGSVLCLSILVTLALESIRTRLDRPASRSSVPWFDAAGALLALSSFCILGNSPIALPETRVRVPAIYERIAEEEGQFALLELPIGAAPINRMLWQTFHGKPIFRGMPAVVWTNEYGNEVMYENEFVRLFNHPASGPTESAKIDRDIRRLSELGFRYFLYHREAGMPVREFESMCSIAEDYLGDPVWSGGCLSAWRIQKSSDRQ